MARYYSHTIILPDESHLDDFVVEINKQVTAYYPFVGEMHSTIYVDTPILLSYRADLDGKTVSLNQLTWALCDEANDICLSVDTLLIMCGRTVYDDNAIDIGYTKWEETSFHSVR